MEIVDIYRETRARLCGLGRELTDDEAASPCPATPEWTVKDVYAHQAGVAADILAGRLEGVATDPWTARQVAARRDLTLADVLDEWDGNAPALEELLANLGDAVDPRLLIDLWTHEQDVRHAVDRPGGRDSSAARYAWEPLVDGLDAAIRHAGLDALELRTGEATVVVGGDTATATVEVPRYELLRASLGRRSPAQMRAWAWRGDPEPYLAVLPQFGPRDDDLVEG
ncbi:MAG: maleylpyruvate isomerase family mycothiol-dependent enzyme [Acidimicrobiia bacterium]|nr:maleylpyruvate isomerase family mycothiol-dependent enzyme [Acidimicrobiia bacterium]